MMWMWLFACGSDEPAWAVNHASVLPDATGLSGTQTWEFFAEGWKGGHAEDAFVCARAQSWVGEVVASPEGCNGCLAAYQVEVSEIETDCPEPYASDAAYAGPLTMGIGDAPAEFSTDNPFPDDAMGWYTSYETGAVQAFGFAWDEALDYGESASGPGWRVGTIYTLWPAVAWDLGG